MDQNKIRKIIHENSSDPYRLVEAVLTEVGFRREYTMLETTRVEGIGISSTTTVPHERWASPWEDMT